MEGSAGTTPPRTGEARPEELRASAPPDWQAIASGDDFKTLLRVKARFIVPATIFFILTYFALPVLVGYFPSFMETNAVGHINLAYLFALAQFVVAWGVMGLYVRRARAFDSAAGDIARRARDGTGRSGR